MRISLDQPTFLTSLTEEKPANNQTDSGASADDFLDFSSTLVNQAPEANTAPSSSLPTPASSDESSSTTELTPEDLANLLLSMGYLAETSAKEALNVNDASETAVSATEQPMDLTKAVMNLETKTPLFSAVQATTPTATPATNAVDTSVKPSLEQVTQSEAVMPASMTLESSKSASALMQPHPGMPLHSEMTADKKPLEIHKAIKALTKPAELLIPTEVMNQTKPKADADKPSSVENTPDQKVVMSLQQMGEWLQAKVSAEPTLIKRMPQDRTPVTENSFGMLPSSMAAGGAATPAKAAWEAKVEVNQVMSNAELNLTTYHANIKIYPPELGKVTAKIKMDKNETTLEITAENKQVKALLQGNLNTLREQFSHSNITLNKIEIVLADQKEASTANPNERGQKQEPQETLSSENNEIKTPTPKRTQKTSENVVDAYV